MHEVEIETGSPGIQEASERTERLASLFEFWNAGAERLYGFSPDERLPAEAHASLIVLAAELQAMRTLIAGVKRTAEFYDPILGIHKPYLSDSDLRMLSGDQAI